MTTLEGRALAVKALKAGQLETMHEREKIRFHDYGFYMPGQIAALSGHDEGLKRYWGAPESGPGLEKWGERVSAQVRDFLHRAKMPPGDPVESMHVFDWTLFHDTRVDFRYDAVNSRAAAPAAESF